METTPRAPSLPWTRLLAALLLHGGILAVLVIVLLAIEIGRWGIEPGQSSIDLHQNQAFIAVLVGHGALAVVGQAAWLVSRRSAATWQAIAAFTTGVSALVQGAWIAFPFALRFAGDTAPLPAGTPGAVTLLVLQVLAGHLIAVLFLVVGFTWVAGRQGAASPAG